MSTVAERARLKISVFLGHPEPCHPAQQAFVDALGAYLDSRGIAPRTLGAADSGAGTPLKAVRRVMLESNGVVTVALRQPLGSDLAAVTREPGREGTLRGAWLTSPWAHVESAMAYQLGLPVLVLREQGVRADGMLEPGAAGVYMPSFRVGAGSEGYFSTSEWNDLFWKWESRVRAVVERKGEPPALY